MNQLDPIGQLGALGRKGRMTGAIAAIGRGEECFEGTPFTLELA